MELTDDDIREFARLWKEEFGEEIELAEARIRAREILELTLLVARPSTFHEP